MITSAMNLEEHMIICGSVRRMFHFIGMRRELFDTPRVKALTVH